MSEIEQLTKLKEETEAHQVVLKNWISLKKNLSAKFKNPSEAFKGLKKEGQDVLAVGDFADYSKGLDLTQLFKDTTLNEENFIKAWEQWEFQYKQNEHKIQMTEEKIELITILEQKDNFKEGYKQYEANKNKKILKLIQNCEDLDSLKEKLDTLVQGGQQSQKEKVDVIQNEQDCFSVILSKKSEIKAPDLQISKLQVKKDSENVEESQVVVNTNNKPKKSYLDGSAAPLQKSKISLTLSNSQNTGSLLTTSRIVSEKNQNKQSYIIEPQVQISPTKGQQYLRNPPISNQQQPQQHRGFQEEREPERRSHKANRMKGDLQSYISELFQSEREQRAEPRTQRVEPRAQREYVKPAQSSDQRGLAGFPNFRNYFKNQSQNRQQQISYDAPAESTDIRKRVENIRYKLDDFQSQKLSQLNTRQPRPQPKQDWTPERPVRFSQPKPKQNSRKSSPQYTPGNTHRLNLDKLKQEKEQIGSGSGKGETQDKDGQDGQTLSMEQLNQTIKGDPQANP